MISNSFILYDVLSLRQAHSLFLYNSSTENDYTLISNYKNNVTLNTTRYS